MANVLTNEEVQPYTRQPITFQGLTETRHSLLVVMLILTAKLLTHIGEYTGEHYRSKHISFNFKK